MMEWVALSAGRCGSEYVEYSHRLSEKQRSAILLRYFQGMNDRKISELYHVSRSAICSRRTRGLRKLKMLLSEGK